MADYAYEDSEAEPLYVAVNPFLTTRRHRPVSVTSGHVLDPENRNVERSNSQDVVVPFAHTPHPQRLSRQAIGAQSLPAQISSQQLSRQAIGAQSLPTQTSSQRLSRQAIGAQYLPVQPSSQQLSRQAIGAQSLPAQPSSQQLSRQAIGAQSLPAQNPFHSAPPVRRTAQLAIRAPSVPAYTPYYSAVPVTLSHAKSEPEYRHWGRSWRLQSQQMVAPDDEQPSTGPALASAPRLGTVRKAAQLAIGAPSVPAYTPSYSTVPATLSHAVSAPEYRHWQRPWRPKSQQIAVPDVLEDEQTIIQDARLRSHSPTRAPSLSTSTSFESLVEEGWKHDGTMGAVRRERTRSPAPSYHSGPTRTRPSPANLKTSRSYAETQASPHERRGRSPLRRGRRPLRLHVASPPGYSGFAVGRRPQSAKSSDSSRERSATARSSHEAPFETRPHENEPTTFPPLSKAPLYPNRRPRVVPAATENIASRVDPQIGLPLPVTSSSERPGKVVTVLDTVATLFFVVVETVATWFFIVVETVATLFFFVVETIPRQMYLHVLLRIPSLYFSRVARIFEDAQLSLPDIKRMARASAEQWNRNPMTLMQQGDEKPLPPSLLNFRSSWESFIDALMREWKTFNVISVLLMSAILTLLQIEDASHPVTRTTALFSLICALMSLLYGCMYIIRFGTMRKMHKASSLAMEAQNVTASIWWNVWVLLAMPAIWLSWSIITFFASIMSFIWLTGSSQDKPNVVLSARAALGPRIGLTFVFAVGLIYFVLIVREFHRYGDPLDRAWLLAVKEWAREMPAAYPNPNPSYAPTQFSMDRKPPRGSGPPLRVTFSSRSLPPDQDTYARSPSPHLGFERNSTRDRPTQDADTRPSSPYPGFERNPTPTSYPSLDPGHSRAISPAPSSSSVNSLPQPPDVNLADMRAPKTSRQQPQAQKIDALGFTSLPPPHHPPRTLPSVFFKTPGAPVRTMSGPFQIMRLGDDVQARRTAYTHPAWVHTIRADAWEQFMADISSAWNGQLPLPQPSWRTSVGTDETNMRTEDDESRAETVRQFIELWNEHYFHPRNLEADMVPLIGNDATGQKYGIDLRLRAPPFADDTDDSSF